MSINKETKPTDDKDLDDLLDSALEDFDKLGMKDVPTSTETKKNDENEDINFLDGDERWNSEFIKQQAKLFGEQMAALCAKNDKMQEGANATLADEGEVNSKVIDSITEVLKGFKEGSDNIESPHLQDDLMGMFAAGMDGDADSNPFIAYAQGMMHSLLSAEVLLPSLKELLEKYPEWLQDNVDKIDPTDKERYTKQHELFKIVCTDLESEKSDDTDEIKNNRFKRVLENMRKLQDYGQPPEEILGIPDASNMPMFDPTNMTDPSQCCLM